MKQHAFEEKYQARWQHFQRELDRLEPKSDISFKFRRLRQQDHDGKTEVQWDENFPVLYREICHDLSLAAQRRYSPQLLERLNRLALGGHRQLYQRTTDFTRQFVFFVARDFPRSVRKHWRPMAIATVLFYLPGLLIFLATSAHPELVYSVMSPEQVRDFEAMYDPGASHRIGSNRSPESDVTMFGFYIANNIGVSFRTFASGILGGLGSAYFLVLNGLIFGALSAHVLSIEFADPFFSFVIGHGSVELTAIVISGGAGLMLGFSWLAPGQRTRGDSVRRAAAECFQLVMGAAVLLIVAALLEAFWSSKVTISSTMKYYVGAVLWALVFAYFTFAGRRRES